jgi:hypothetical protein
MQYIVVTSVSTGFEIRKVQLAGEPSISPVDTGLSTSELYLTTWVRYVFEVGRGHTYILIVASRGRVPLLIPHSNVCCL